MSGNERSRRRKVSKIRRIIRTKISKGREEHEDKAQTGAKAPEEGTLSATAEKKKEEHLFDTV